jgi:hypothetical protein
VASKVEVKAHAVQILAVGSLFEQVSESLGDEKKRKRREEEHTSQMRQEQNERLHRLAKERRRIFPPRSLLSFSSLSHGMHVIRGWRGGVTRKE